MVRELGLNSLLLRNDFRLNSFNILDHDWSFFQEYLDVGLTVFLDYFQILSIFIRIFKWKAKVWKKTAAAAAAVSVISVSH